MTTTANPMNQIYEKLNSLPTKLCNPVSQTWILVLVAS